MAGISRNNLITTPAVGREGGGYGMHDGPSGVNFKSRGWTPTTTYLMVMVVLEVVAYGALRYAFRSAHGG